MLKPPLIRHSRLCYGQAESFVLYSLRIVIMDYMNYYRFITRSRVSLRGYATLIVSKLRLPLQTHYYKIIHLLEISRIHRK